MHTPAHAKNTPTHLKRLVIDHQEMGEGMPVTYVYDEIQMVVMLYME